MKHVVLYRDLKEEDLGEEVKEEDDRDYKRGSEGRG